MKTTIPQPEIDQMRLGMAKAAQQAVITRAAQAEELFALHARANAPDAVQPAHVAPALPASEEALFSVFRADMRRIGLTPYDVQDSMRGLQYEGPCVNVRDPSHAQSGTRLLLVTHGLGNNSYRMYPVLKPLVLPN